ncbi:MAG: hybrid sensor histidine kinase/response regulator [Desulfobacteraceae bacterium]|nr:hybrid sensor histidine kinase/response regulator [Desulfobacteraceae bacterium]
MAAFIDDQETLQAFKEESLEHLNGIENDLLAIEEAGADLDQELVNKVFRAMHSIKGGAGFLGLDAVKSLAHAAEDLMNKIRNAELLPTAPVISSLLEAADVVTRLLRQTGNGPEIDITVPLAALRAALTAAEEPGPAAVSPTSAEAGPPAAGEDEALSEPLLAVHRAEVDNLRLSGQQILLLKYDPISSPEGRGLAALLADLGGVGQTLGVRLGEQEIALPVSEPEGGRLPATILYATLMDKEMLIAFAGLGADEVRELPAARPDESVSTPRSLPAAGTSEATAAAPSPSPSPAPQRRAGDDSAKSGQDGSLRVNVRLLDSLMALAGELVLTRNQFLQVFHSQGRLELEAVSQRLNLVTSELQEAIMSTRMQPVGNVFNKFKRVVRDLAQKLGKEIELSIEGGEVEMDKTIIEALADPLTHLVRNSVDHGIERPADRERAGKPPAGLLEIKAFHEGGHVIIEIVDDGAGIDTARLKEKALGMGTHDRAQLDAMPERELLKLIFLPGLSTAREVTEVSGRGVGMDVVHANLSRIGGVFDIASKKGRGTTITIKLPLTLAIIPSLIVSLAGERYAIPQVNLVELVRVPPGRVKERIERIGAALLIRLRGELLPLIRLAEVLGVEERVFCDPQTGEAQRCRRWRVEDRRQPAGSEAEHEGQAPPDPGPDQRQARERRSSPDSAINILVLSAGKFRYGLLVDTLLDSEEIVVKPLGAHLRGCQIYAGATIQGDGRVALILDVAGISKVMNLEALADRLPARDKEMGQVQLDAQSLLLVRNSPQEQLAIPLILISRIEKISRRQLEVTGGRLNMQYRGVSLPLFGIEEAARVAPVNTEAAQLSVVVFPFGGKEIGILVSEVIDIVSFSAAIDDTTHKQPGIMGSAIIMGRITMLVDLFEVVATVMPEWVKYTQLAAAGPGQGQHILVVEDSAFFRRQICDFVSAAGYQPFSAQDGLEGFAVLEREKIDLVLTDIEMPNLDGLELTARIRADSRWARLPVIAVTSLSGEAAERRGRKAGVDEYLIKLDREKIIQAIGQHLRR